MKRFIEGSDRTQSTLLPECLDDWVHEINPVRVVDAFVDQLDSQNWASRMSSPRRPDDLDITHRRCSSFTSTVISTA